MVGSPAKRSSARTITWREVARAANVSPTTASLALNDHPRVALRTRQRVAEAAARLGYVNNRAARRLARSRGASRAATSFDQVGLILLVGAGGEMDSACLEIMRGAEQGLSALHACLVFVRVGTEDDWNRARRLVQGGVVDAWMVIGPMDDATAERLEGWGTPFVILGDHRCTRDVHCVNIDNYNTGRAAVHHLSGRGHRRIAFCGGVYAFAYQRNALEGYRAAVRELGLDDDEERLVVHDSPDAWLRKLGDAPRPTAFFSTEMNGARFATVLKGYGFDIPRTVALLSCELPASSGGVPGEPRFESPLDEIGRQGAVLLHKVVSEPHVASSEIKLSVRLVDAP